MKSKNILRVDTIVLVLCLFNLIFTSSYAGTPVQTWLKTSWDAPPLILEILESVTAENSSAYFPLVNEFLKGGLFSSKLTVQEVYNSAFDIIEKNQFLSTPTTKSLVEFALSLHTTAPAIHAYYHYYNATVMPSRSDSNQTFNSDCEVWIDWYDHQACSVEEFQNLVGFTDFEKFKLDVVSDTPSPKLLPFDHVLKSQAKTPKPIVILYADLLSPKFPKFHDFVSTLVEKVEANYVLRYVPPKGNRDSLYLSGYGVELALKNMDYIVVDDRKVEEIDDENKEIDPKDSKDEPLNKSGDHLFDQYISEIKPLKSGEIKSLGVKAAQFILGSHDPLKAFAQLSQDFPKYSHAISQLPLNSSLEQEIEKNRYINRIDANSFWLNGLIINPTSADPFSLLKLLRRERQTVLSLKSLGMNSRQAIDLLSSPVISQAQSPQDFSRGVFDVRDTSPNKNVVAWLNDLERDERYAMWPDRIYELLRPVYPGQMRYLRKNLFSTLFVIDLSAIESLRVISELYVFISRNVPLRFGLVPLFSKDHQNSILMARIFYYVVDQYSPSMALELLNFFHSKFRKSPTADFIQASKEEYDKFVQGKNPQNKELISSFAEIIDGNNSLVEEQINGAMEFIHRFRIDASGNGILFMNGKLFDMTENYQRDMVQTVNEHTVFLQQKVYAGEIDDQVNVYEYFMTLPNLPSRRNPYVFVSEVQPLKTIDLVNGFPIKDLKYISKANNNDEKIPVTLLLITNFDCEHGAKQALNALKFLDSTKDVRLSLMHHPGSGFADKPEAPSMSSMIHYIFYEETVTPSPKDLQAIFGEYLDAISDSQIKGGYVEGEQIPIDADGKINSARSAGWQVVDRLKAEKYWQSLSSSFKETLRFNDDDTVLILNGRIIGPFPLDDGFQVDDFELLVDYELSERVSPVTKAIDELQLNIELKGSHYSDFIAKASSIISASSTSDVPVGLFNNQEHRRNVMFKELQGDISRIEIGNPEDAIYNFAAVIDPISEIAQKWSTILITLSQIDGVFLEVYMSPSVHMEEISLKRFYRYVLSPKLTFNSTTGTPIPPSAYFNGLPEEPLLTLGMDVISPWLVTPKSSIYDLDNIQLSKVDARSRAKGVEATFELKHILIEGHARDITLNAPPSGLQLILGTNSYPSMVDTIVMANLGYFQLKANPGVWTLRLRGGRSIELFDIQSVGSEGWLSRSVEEIGNEIVLDNFEGLLLYPRMMRKPGKENEKIYENDDSGSDDGIWDYLKNKFSITKEESKKKKADINIFSVASGHLYERFLSIMIISVLRHTKSSVKFWFIENFLSPSFKDFIPHMAKEYNFEYELVTYKWPHWLRAQTEKQRTIWGYKILFLDVLFPLDLDKVIFVDADQIVRADLKELVDMDLQGAPYGYTPFCDNRPEMDGFRFWKSGYWQEHLNGKPYHISALYVIDLQRFRQMAAGDYLRGQYQALSADPNSLSNLDQDLPNNMQHMIPIFSLPQEWLWCETWCSDESLARAKTIDLCNNPLTKEPKLDRAKRQIPEWESYDKEVADLSTRIVQQKVLSSSHIVIQNDQETSDVERNEETFIESVAEDNTKSIEVITESTGKEKEEDKSSESEQVTSSTHKDAPSVKDEL
ncbi:1716_t:CDS:10 [Acaulospora morrowiae]|uniref:1716_t:CDS:1 n=1 Tax=Acaulospora morrowiae TaxID=94023 RepID=A0A9N8YP88_9GLOM|nr:1716_t:CDS:10 [Acaulospora morrowiae]